MAMKKMLGVMFIGVSLCSSLLACDFDCALQTHLKAIQEKDWLSFEKTLTRSSLPFILPNGVMMMDAQHYRDALQPWFEAGGWQFNAKEIYRNVTPEMGVILLDVDYDEADRGGKPYHLDHYLTLIFKKEKDAWRLVFDQNTRYEPKSDVSNADELKPE